MIPFYDPDGLCMFCCDMFVKFMPGISATSCITWATKTLLLSVIMSVGKYACLVIMSIMNFAVFTAVGWILGRQMHISEKHLELQ